MAVPITKDVEAKNERGAILTGNCPRCHTPCMEGSPPSKDAQPIRRSTFKRGGVCVACALTHWIKNTPALMYAIGMMEKRGHSLKEAFALPHVRAQCGRILETGGSDATLSEIDFDWMVSKWELPFDGASSAEPRNE